MKDKIFVIAEAGVNHNGNLKLAFELVDAAKKSGADAVKFQTFKAENMVIKSANKAKYQKKYSLGNNQLEMLKKLELSQEQFAKLFNYCKKKKIVFLSTPFDEESAIFLNRLPVEIFKIGSGDLTNIPFLKFVARFKKPIILSTGMSNLSEVREAIYAIKEAGNINVTLLHCTSNYPAKYEDINLNAMLTLRKKFYFPIGYSDHTQGVEIAIAAAALGAKVIEKHFTLDRNLEGPDHRASIEPNEFKKMGESIRNIEKALGNGIKNPRETELEIQKIARRSIVAACDIVKGQKINKKLIAFKRPGIGIKPKYANKLIGKVINKNIKKDDLLIWSDFR